MPIAKPAWPDRLTVSSAPRLEGLDTLRAIAAVLVVFFHASIPYMTYPLPHLVWPARDSHPSALADAITWSCECFLMPVFFVLAGFFSHGLITARGEKYFLADRTTRVWWVSFAFGVVVLPLSLVIWSLGWVADGIYVPQDIFNTGLPSQIDHELYGVGHIWFLQNLYIYCLLLAGVTGLAKFTSGDHAGILNRGVNSLSFMLQSLDRMVLSVWKPLIAAIPCAAILYWDPRIVLGFYQQFIPVFSKLVYFAVFYFVGVVLSRNRRAVREKCRYGPSYLLIAASLYVITLPLIHAHVVVPLTGSPRVLLASLVAAISSLATFGLFSTFYQLKQGGNVATRYLAEASYWVYLVHVPLVGLTQIAIAPLAISAFSKYLMAGSTALALSLMAYEAMARYSWLGEFLNGHRRTKGSDAGHDQPSVGRQPDSVQPHGRWAVRAPQIAELRREA